jgi:hypothetical protein
MRFSATEAGFQDGLGGASNNRSKGASHYVLFGLQEDNQHSGNSGVYFEYDDQANGSVNGVEHVIVSNDMVEFLLADGTKIVVVRKMPEQDWASFLHGIDSVFEAGQITRR